MARIVNAQCGIGAGISVNVTPRLVPFPTRWDTSIANFISEPDFDAILIERGRLAAADGNQEQEIFDALSNLINKNDYGSAVRFVGVELWKTVTRSLLGIWRLP